MTHPEGNTDGTAGSPLHPAPLSSVLLASRPQRDVRRGAGSALGSILLHGAAVTLLAWATAAAGIDVIGDEQVTIIELPDETPPPPPPPVEPVAAPPLPAEVAKGFQTLSIPDVIPPVIPPPAVGVRISAADFSGVGREGGRAEGKEGAPVVDDLTIAPSFTPYTVAPELRNVTDVQRALSRSYPPLLRDAGIGGTALLWFLIDENGVVIRTQVKESSGYTALDNAASEVATVMQFSPAINRDRRVAVWVALPIVFTIR